MNAYSNDYPPLDPFLSMVRGELSSATRWCYRCILLVASVALALVLSLWLTEPRPLTFRLHFAFAAITGINVGWIGVMTWVLTRRNCPTATARLATAWMATAGSLLFLLISVPIAVLRGGNQPAIVLGVLGIALVAVVALGMLRRAYAIRRALRERLAEIEGGADS